MTVTRMISSKAMRPSPRRWHIQCSYVGSDEAWHKCCKKDSTRPLHAPLSSSSLEALLHPILASSLKGVRRRPEKQRMFRSPSKLSITQHPAHRGLEASLKIVRKGCKHCLLDNGPVRTLACEVLIRCSSGTYFCTHSLPQRHCAYLVDALIFSPWLSPLCQLSYLATSHM